VLPLLLVLSLTTPIPADTPKPDWYSDCGWIVRVIESNGQGWYWDLDDEEQRAEFYEVCRQVAPFFTEARAEYLGAPGTGGTADQIKAMAVVQCESGLDNMANFRRWGDGTRGIWSFMRHLNWTDRLGYPDLDSYDNVQASFLASIMVYGGVNSRVDAPNFWWWWSCSRSYQRPLRSMGIPVPESSYCPADKIYWNDVRPGSGVAARKECVG